MAAPFAAAIKSVPWRSRDALAVFILPWIILPIAVIVFLQLLEPYIPAFGQVLRAYDASDPRVSFAFVLIDLIGSFSVIYYYLRKYKAPFTQLGFRKFSITKVILYFVVIALSFSVLVGMAYFIVQLLDPSFNADQTQTNEFTQNPSGFSLWALVIIPPIVEETVFRGFMFPAFAKKFGIPIGAIIASLLFGFAHLQLNVSIYTFILSILLCLLYSRIGSIIPGILVHMINNYIAYIGMSAH